MCVSVFIAKKRGNKVTPGRGNKGYLCGECGEKFDNELDVKSHMFAKHMCEYNKCDCCLYKQGSPFSLESP